MRPWHGQNRRGCGSENTHQFELRLDIESDRFPGWPDFTGFDPISEYEGRVVVPTRCAGVETGRDFGFYRGKGRESQSRSWSRAASVPARQIEVIGDVGDGDTVIIRGE